MKTIIASILLLGSALSEVDAQTKAGSLMIGGSAILQRSKFHSETVVIGNPAPSTTFSITPTVGYFPINNFMAGLQGSYLHNWSDQNDIKSRTNNFAIGPILRYYIPLGGKFAVFPEVVATYNKMSSRAESNVNGTIIDNKFKSINYVYRAGAGVTWFVRPNIGVELIFAYRQTNQKSTSTYSSLMYTNLALQFYLPKQ